MYLCISPNAYFHHTFWLHLQVSIGADDDNDDAIDEGDDDDYYDDEDPDTLAESETKISNLYVLTFQQTAIQTTRVNSLFVQ